MEKTKIKKISQEDIEKFIDGRDPQKRIVNLEYNYRDDFVTVIYRNENDQKCKTKESFYPFCWATLKACQRLCHGDKNELVRIMKLYGIGVKKLSQTNIKGEVRHEFDDGYLFMFFAKKPMSYSRFLNFFKECDNPVYSRNKEDEVNRPKSESKQYLCVTPQEQFLISTGKRFFKGYDDYDQVLKMTFDLETTGLDTEKDKINQIGIKFNRPFLNHPEGFEKIFTVTGNTKEEREDSERFAIDQMFRIIYTFKPDIITAHNGENFDWNMIIGACKRLGMPIEQSSARYFGGDYIHKEEKESILKMGGEMENYHATIVPGVIVTDSLHAVRRAQALDSNMLKADLKYVTEYSKMKKPNRVYVPGDKIATTWADIINEYAFNNENGDWYRYNPELNDEDNGEIYGGKKSFIPEHGFIRDGYELTTGKYIVERYLLDDLWECDRVEYRYNTPNFLVCKMLPVPYRRCTTMGTAVQWKALMLAWSYEQGLAIPMFGEQKTFTGGLSRLLRTGFVKKVVKLDYNSLYPSIILTWGITDPTDLMLSMLHFLEHVLTQREKYKGLKKAAGKKKEKAETEEEKRKYAEEESFNDKKQLPLKIFGNSFFGSYGAPNVFPFGSLKCAEQTTCTGRMALRLMISHFKKLGYEPIVGDSFTEDTPVFIRYIKTGMIDIVPICELISEEHIETDALGREYDYSKKPYQVLCRSGWVSPSYIYRHKTNKDIYEVTDDEMRAEVTEDHSLFDTEMNKINPSEINSSTELEYYSGNISNLKDKEVRDEWIGGAAKRLADNDIDRVPLYVLNGTKYNAQMFYEAFMEFQRDDIQYSKTCLAGLQYLKKSIS
jgi:DNA polymerase elongation subunit (family B)